MLLDYYRYAAFLPLQFFVKRLMFWTRLSYTDTIDIPLIRESLKYC